MRAVTGVFRSRAEAEEASRQLGNIGLPKSKIMILTPHLTENELSKVQVGEGEQPGMVTALGAVAGGAVGAGVVEALAVGLLPGVGPILAIGLAGGALIGALTGGAIGHAVEGKVFGTIPEEELFFYESAARQGRTVLIATADGDRQAEIVRGTFERAGAETIDEARKKWWLGIRDIEKEHYQSPHNFERDEPDFRAGFEAALRPSLRGKSFEQSRDELAARYPAYNHPAFQHGYKRGAAYRQALFEQSHHGPW